MRREVRRRFVGEAPRACCNKRCTVDLGRLYARAALRMDGRGADGETGADSIARHAATRLWRNASSDGGGDKLTAAEAVGETDTEADEDDEQGISYQK